MLNNKLFFSILFLCYWTEAAPAGLGTLEFDNLDTNLDDLKYEVEDLNDYYDNLDDSYDDDGNESDTPPKATTKISGFKKKNATNRGSKSRHNVQDLRKFLKAVGLIDNGSYSDDEIYAAAEGLAAEAVGAKGNEVKKYRKGTKTRGFHKVHHKDEYKKDKEFYEDDEVNRSTQKVGGKALGYNIRGGAGFDSGHFRHNRLKGLLGTRGYLDKGFRNNQYVGHSDSQGIEGSFNSEKS